MSAGIVLFWLVIAILLTTACGPAMPAGLARPTASSESTYPTPAPWVANTPYSLPTSPAPVEVYPEPQPTPTALTPDSFGRSRRLMQPSCPVRWQDQAVSQPTETPAFAPPPTLPPGLVYWTTEGFWRVDASGHPAHLFDRGDARLPPDGTRALYTQDSDLWLADLPPRALVVDWIW